MSVREIQRESLGTGGLRLFWRVWAPDTPAGRVSGRVLVAHGYAEHGGRYRGLAERLVDAGLHVVVPDHRGHGRSEGRPVSVRSFDDYVADLGRIAEEAEREDGEAPTLLLGHSMGGLIALLHAYRHQNELRGLILSAPAVVPPRLLPGTRLLGRLLSRVAPDLGVTRLPLDRISRDPAVLAAYRADPWVHRRRVRARLGAELLRAMAEAAEGLPRLVLPVLVVQGTADEIVPPSAAPFVHSRVGSPDRTLRQYPGLFHEVLNEPERDQVIAEMLDWMRARLPHEAAQGAPALPP